MYIQYLYICIYIYNVTYTAVTKPNVGPLAHMQFVLVKESAVLFAQHQTKSSG